jgi:hypothetical protein
MKRDTLNFVVDLVALLVGLAIVATGLLMWFVLPAGSRNATVWGLSRHDYGDWHAYLSFSFIGLMVLHLFLHWGWVCNLVCRLTPGVGSLRAQRRRRIIMGSAITLLIAGGLAGFVYIAGQNVVGPTGRGGAIDHGQTHDSGIGRGGGGGYRGGRGGDR